MGVRSSHLGDLKSSEGSDYQLLLLEDGLFDPRYGFCVPFRAHALTNTPFYTPAALWRILRGARVTVRTT